MHHFGWVETTNHLRGDHWITLGHRRSQRLSAVMGPRDHRSHQLRILQPKKADCAERRLDPLGPWCWNSRHFWKDYDDSSSGYMSASWPTICWVLVLARKPWFLGTVVVLSATGPRGQQRNHTGSGPMESFWMLFIKYLLVPPQTEGQVLTVIRPAIINHG